MKGNYDYLHKYSKMNNGFLIFYLLPFGFICYPSPVPPWLWTYSSVVRFCQTMFATARTTFVNVHTPRLKRVFLREWWGASRNFGEGSGNFLNP